MTVQCRTQGRKLLAAPSKDVPPPSTSQTVAEVLFAQLHNLQPDDWHGITDPRARKKLQNRANQRALRARRKALDKAAATASTSTAMLVKTDSADIDQAMLALCASELSSIDTLCLLHAHLPSIQQTQTRLEALALSISLSSKHRNPSPRSDLLLHLFTFNFSRALIENIRIFGFTAPELDDEALSPLTSSLPHPRVHEFETKVLPRDLSPTEVQRTIPHHPWLDLLPVAKMRDNLIRAGESYDEEELCGDMKGRPHHRDGIPVGGEGEAAGIIVWRDPWDAGGWEVTDKFARKWGWVIWGCEDLFRSTDYWRAKRGERPLFGVGRRQ